jgi:hypothetical protein
MTTKAKRTIAALHRRAMDAASRARLAVVGGHAGDPGPLWREAFDLESRAARLSAPLADWEPSRAVLHRSAASLALKCGEERAAERLIGEALAGDPPEELLEELRDLLEQVHFRRHLRLRGLELSPAEVQMSMSGGATGHGFVLGDSFAERISKAEKIVTRTIERRLGMPYRDSGGPQRAVRELFPLLVSVPRAASFAVTLRVGRPAEQMPLPLTDPGSGAPLSGEDLLPYPDELVRFDVRAALDDIVDGLRELNDGEAGALADRIPDEAYRRNFVQLGLKLAPDGKDVGMVAFTALRDGAERAVALRRTAKELEETVLGSSFGESPEPLPPIQVLEGVLRYADGTETDDERDGVVKVVDDTGSKHTLVVKPGMMADIVRPYFDRRVVIRTVKSGRKRLLELISPAEPPPLPTAGGGLRSPKQTA